MQILWSFSLPDCVLALGVRRSTLRSKKNETAVLGRLTFVRTDRPVLDQGRVSQKSRNSSESKHSILLTSNMYSFLLLFYNCASNFETIN